MHLFRQKMEIAGVGEPAIRSFERNYRLLLEQDAGWISEKVISPVASLSKLKQIEREMIPQVNLLPHTAILKLNGGLGTSMGLEKVKSLLEVRDGLTFLDLIGSQICHLSKTMGVQMRFLLLDSFGTSADTLAWLQRHPDLGTPSKVELMQNKVPKVDANTLTPVKWPENPDLEWCPPGHGDLYSVLASDGNLDRLLDEGIRYLFVSNSDNLGATLDLMLLTWFAQSEAPFLMEVTARTESDRKGGHLAIRENHFILRESAQCPDADIAAFQDIARHRFFNTNNLWLRLDHLRDSIQKFGGFLPLPLICNKKTVDPRNKNTPPVYQLEVAMGAAIECFANAQAVEVPRTRFAPVKTTGDLLTLRSDAYVVADNGQVVLGPECNGVPPKVNLDEHYKLVDQLDHALGGGVPSLKNCQELVVRGPLRFSKNVIFRGKVVIQNASSEWKDLPAGVYENTTFCI